MQPLTIDLLTIFGVVLALALIFIGFTRWTMKREAKLDKIHEFLLNLDNASDRGQADTTIRPDISLFLSTQWRFIGKIFHYRFEKSLIAKKIASNHIKEDDIIFLDSGSTTDLITSELLLIDKGAQIISNNVFAAMHLVGTKKLNFNLLSGKFDERFAAVYSPEASKTVRGQIFNIYIIAAARFRRDKGIMVSIGDDNNKSLKSDVLTEFASNDKSKLIIAIDASKFFRDIDDYMPIIDTRKEWDDLLDSSAKRITVVTNPAINFPKNKRSIIENEVKQLREARITVDDKDIDSV
jgi:hypothetical protein